jgi:hypothetical protein
MAYRAKEYQDLIAGSVASTDSEANEPVAKNSAMSELAPRETSTSSQYQLECPALVEMPHLQSACGSGEGKIFATGFGLRGPSYKSKPVDRLNNRRLISTSELAFADLVSNGRTTNSNEFELEMPPDNIVLHSDFPKAAKPSSTNIVTKRNSQSHSGSDLSGSALDVPTEKGSTRLTAWSEVQRVPSLINILEEKYTESAKDRDENMKFRGKAEEQDETKEMVLTREMMEKEKKSKQSFQDPVDKGALEPKKIGHRRNVHSKSKIQFEGKRPDPIQTDQLHRSTGGSIEKNEFSSYHSRAAVTIPELSPHDSKPSNSAGKGSPRCQHSHLPSPTRDRDSSPARQLERVSEKDGLEPETLGQHLIRSRPSTKKLFGEGGLLGESIDLTLGKKSPPKRLRLVDRIKNKVEKFVSLSSWIALNYLWKCN